MPQLIYFCAALGPTTMQVLGQLYSGRLVLVVLVKYTLCRYIYIYIESEISNINIRVEKEKERTHFSVVV
jgi:hypothetical protein